MPQADDFSIFNDTLHMLRWLADEPFQAIRSQIEAGLRRQDPGCSVESLVCSGEPCYLTAVVRKDANDAEAFLLARLGVAFQIEIVVLTSAAQRAKLNAVCSYIGTGLHDPPHRKIRFDLEFNGVLSEAEEGLRAKIYEQSSD